MTGLSHQLDRAGGMGAVAPMGTLSSPVKADFAGIAVMRPRPSSRPDQPVSFTSK